MMPGPSSGLDVSALKTANFRRFVCEDEVNRVPARCQQAASGNLIANRRTRKPFDKVLDAG
jgi:hypothetical protein